MADTEGDDSKSVGVLGATSLVGACLLPVLAEAGWMVTALSRSAVDEAPCYGIAWHQLPLTGSTTLAEHTRGNRATAPYWICAAPIWVLPDYFPLLEAQGARRLVVLSSTSRFTKDDSTDTREQAAAQQLADAESRVQTWAQSHGVEWVILRPTLIYGLGLDKNVSEIARFIRRFGFFPIFGKARGLRQPVHATDVAWACAAALRAPSAANRAYNISGGEALPYRTMLARIFNALGRTPRLLFVPLWAFKMAIWIARALPRYRKWSAAMAERMNKNMVFDHAEATRDFGFRPKAFALSAKDVNVDSTDRKKTA